MIKLNVTTWKDSIMDWALSLTEIAVSIIKAISIVGGIIGANLADIGFGTLALNFMFGGSGFSIGSMTPASILALSISAGTSAIQIYLWTLLAKRGIGLKHIMKIATLPKDIQSFIGGAVVVWILDNILDISVLSILIKGSLYEGGSWFVIVKVVIYILVFLLCGFTEPLTANMRQMLENGNTPVKPMSNNTNGNGNKPYYGSNNNQPNRSGNNNNQNKHTQNKGTVDVASYLAGKKQIRPVLKTAKTQQDGRTEPIYHPVGQTVKDEEFDEMDVDEYMEMLNKLNKGKG